MINSVTLNFSSKKPPKIKIQQAMANDINAIDKITREKENRKALPWVMKVTLNDAVNDPKRHILLVAKNQLEDIVGFIRLYCRNDKTATLHEIVIKETSKHQGIGESLLKEGEKLAKEKGSVKIKLKSPIDLENSHKFFVKNNFLQTGAQQSKKRLNLILEKEI